MSLAPQLDPVPATTEDAVLTAMVSMGRRLRQRLPDDELELTSITLMKTLAHHGALRVSALADRVHLDASTVSRQVASLEDRHLVERTVDPHDRRATRVALNPEGSSTLSRGAQRRRELIAGWLTDWDAADRETLRLLLNRLTHDLNTAHENAHENQDHA